MLCPAAAQEMVPIEDAPYYGKGGRQGVGVRNANNLVCCFCLCHELSSIAQCYVM